MEASLPVAVRKDVESAKAMTLVALVFEAIIFAASTLVGGTLIILVFPVWPALPLWSQLLIVSGWIILALLLFLTYHLVYRELLRGMVSRATAPALILGILELFVGVIPGIFLIIAYFKSNNAQGKMLLSHGKQDLHGGGMESAR
ncbi:MAG: hypothetical protein ACE5HJ_00035 [Thermoplasmata archaeon]